MLASGARYELAADGRPISRGLFLVGGIPEPVAVEKQFSSLAVGERGNIYSGKKLPFFEHRRGKLGTTVSVDLFCQ